VSSGAVRESVMGITINRSRCTAPEAGPLCFLHATRGGALPRSGPSQRGRWAVDPNQEKKHRAVAERPPGGQRLPLQGEGRRILPNMMRGRFPLVRRRMTLCDSGGKSRRQEPEGRQRHKNAYWVTDGNSSLRTATTVTAPFPSTCRPCGWRPSTSRPRSPRNGSLSTR